MERLERLEGVDPGRESESIAASAGCCRIVPALQLVGPIPARSLTQDITSFWVTDCTMEGFPAPDDCHA
ncbi:MAG: hypothetical protein WD768_03320 [Phycisphaeraceae bacterium]